MPTASGSGAGSAARAEIPARMRIKPATVAMVNLDIGDAPVRLPCIASPRKNRCPANQGHAMKMGREVSRREVMQQGAAAVTATVLLASDNARAIAADDL